MCLVDTWTKQETKTTKAMTKMNKYKLPKYCPYCGGKLKTDDKDEFNGKQSVWYECESCHLTPILRIDKGDSVAMYIPKEQIEKET